MIRFYYGSNVRFVTVSTIQYVPRMIIDPLSQAMTAEHLKGDELLLPLSYLWRAREDRTDLLRLFRRSSNMCGAIPLIISRGEGLKFAIAVATDDGICVRFDNPGGITVASIILVEGPDSIVQRGR
jgi:hypothetical protein